MASANSAKHVFAKALRIYAHSRNAKLTRNSELFGVDGIGASCLKRVLVKSAYVGLSRDKSEKIAKLCLGKYRGRAAAYIKRANAKSEAVYNSEIIRNISLELLEILGNEREKSL